MINWIANLLGINKTQDKVDAEQENKPIERRYYKVKVKSYYGLCGIKVIYGEADLIYVLNGFSTKIADDYDSYTLSLKPLMSIHAIIPKGAEFVSEREYLLGTSK